MHGHVYTTGYLEELDGIIHKYTLAGEHVASFGVPYKDPSPFVRSSLADRVVLECNKTHRVIAYAHRYIPVITGFSDTGHVRWRVKLGDMDIAPAEVSRTVGGQFSLSFGTTRSGQSRDLKILGHLRAEAFIVSYYTEGLKKTGKQHFFKMNADTGQGAYLGWSSGWQGDISQPRVIALDADRLYTQKSIPYPRLGIYPRPDLIQ